MSRMREPTAYEIRVLDALVAHARPIILTEFTADSCIASTRLGLDVLAYFGITGREYAVLVAAFNREAAALLEAGVSMEDIGARTSAIPADVAGGPWTIGIGASPLGGRSGGWSGHLVIGIPSIGVLVDLSADQASRPHKGMVFAPSWQRVADPDWFTDPTGKHGVQDTVTGMLMIVDREAAPDPTGYLESPNWRRRDGRSGGEAFKRLTGQIIRRMKDDLAGDPAGVTGAG
jgi:hypothetical protein